MAAIDSSQCAEMIAHVARAACPPPVTLSAPRTAPSSAAAPDAPVTDLDALAVAVTSQGSAVSMMGTGLAVLGVVIAVVALIGAVTWSYFIRVWVRENVQKWMDENAPGMIAKYQAEIAGKGKDSPSPDEQARGLGEESP